jgi:cytidine deaminase
MNYTELTEQDKEVLQQAIAASSRLYVKGIQEVGAALRTSSGELFSGIHFETATGFATICGEVAAMCCMVSAGHRDLETIAAVWRDQAGQHFLLPPCGRCREMMSDFNPNTWVIVTTGANHWDVDAITKAGKVRVADLLPLKSHGLKLE